MSTTPEMGLQIPEVGDTDYVTQIEESLEAIDEHDHATGNGVQIPTGGITDGAVTAVKIASDAVTTVKILNSNVTTAKIADGAVTSAKRAALGQQVSVSSGGFVTTSSGESDVTGLSVTITTSGRPVKIQLMHDGNTNGDTGTIVSGTSGESSRFFIYRDSTLISNQTLTASNSAASIPPSSVSHIDVVAAGTYTYKLAVFLSSGSVAVNYSKLIAYEL